MDGEREVNLFAEDMYRYLFLTRMGIEDTLKKNTLMETDRNDLHHFTSDVGKAILMTCYQCQGHLWEEFTHDYRTITQDLDTCILYCFLTAIRLTKKSDDIFYSLFSVGAMILELVNFCRWHDFECFNESIACKCWVQIFQYSYKRPFFENGGWQTQRTSSRILARLCDMVKFEEPCEAGNIRLQRGWLMRFDRNIFQDFSLPAAYVPPFVTITEQDMMQKYGSELPQPEIQLSSEGMRAHELSGAANQGNIQVELRFELSSQSTEKEVCERRDEVPDLESFSPIEPKSEKQLGAIPKSLKFLCKDSELPSTGATSFKEKRLYSLKHAICDDDTPGKDLCLLMSFGNNAEYLMNDNRFGKMLKIFINSQENRRDSSRLLEIAREIVRTNLNLENSEIDTCLVQSFLLGNESVVEEELGENKQSNIRTLGVLHSPPKQTLENTLGASHLISSVKYKSGITQESINSSVSNLKIDIGSKENEPKRGCDPGNKESSTRCSENGNFASHAAEISGFMSYDNFIREIMKQHSSNHETIKKLRDISKPLEVEKFNRHDKIQIAKNLLTDMSAFISKTICNVARMSNQINALNRTEQSNYDAALKYSIEQHQNDNEQINSKIETINCNYCICDKMKILIELMAKIKILDIEKFAKKTLNERSKSEIKTTKASPSDGRPECVCPLSLDGDATMTGLLDDIPSSSGEKLILRLPGATEEEILPPYMVTVVSSDNDDKKHILPPIQEKGGAIRSCDILASDGIPEQNASPLRTDVDNIVAGLMEESSSSGDESYSSLPGETEVTLDSAMATEVSFDKTDKERSLSSIQDNIEEGATRHLRVSESDGIQEQNASPLRSDVDTVLEGIKKESSSSGEELSLRLPGETDDVIPHSHRSTEVSSNKNEKQTNLSPIQENVKEGAAQHFSVSASDGIEERPLCPDAYSLQGRSMEDMQLKQWIRLMSYLSVEELYLGLPGETEERILHSGVATGVSKDNGDKQRRLSSTEENVKEGTTRNWKVSTSDGTQKQSSSSSVSDVDTILTGLIEESSSSGEESPGVTEEGILHPDMATGVSSDKDDGQRRLSPIQGNLKRGTTQRCKKKNKKSGKRKK